MRFHENQYSPPGHLDFIPRQRTLSSWKLVSLFAIIAAILLFLFLTPETLNNKNIGGIGIISLIGFLCFHTIYRKQQNLDLVMATEYQNMLFAQAITLGFSFCLIVRRDGTMVYADDGLRSLFNNFNYADSAALEGLFNEGNIAKLDRERLMGAVYSSASERLIFPLCPTGSTIRDYVVSIEPLPRPGGYSLIRGREYLGTRTGAQVMPDALRITSPEKIDYLLTHSPVAHYITDNFGRIEYVNPALNTLLGYNAGEIIESKLSIHKLFNQLNGNPVPDDYTLSEHRCSALLNQKQHHLVAATLEQRLMRNAEGKIIGATGCMLPSAPINH